MLSRVLIVAGVISLVSGYNIVPGPKVLATKGEVWPKPQQQQSGQEILVIKDPNNFEFKILQENCNLLEEAIKRYKNIIADYSSNLKNEQKIMFYELDEYDVKNFDLTNLASLDVILTQPCNEEYPSLSMDEYYEINVNVKKQQALLTSKSIWGIIRGLETFSQLLYVTDENIPILAINETSVIDFPRFPHRGLMLDTSRHFISMPYILRTLDAMAYNKLNVFHWHIVDDQSFPYQSKAFPELSLKGAYHKTMVYTPENVQTVIEYAKLRGIRVMSEFDTPGHTRSWGEGISKLLTTCYSENQPNGYFGPIDPSRNTTYEFLNKFFKEVVSVFPDQYVHLGGDEVDFDCWQSNPVINLFMSAQNITSYAQLEAFYIQKLVDIVDNLKTNSVVWEEVFVNGVNLPKDTVVHVWKGNGQEVLANVTKAGLPALLSACWYLDHIDNGGDWLKFYKCEPYSYPGTPSQKKLVMGGEACMWAEVVDTTNVISRVWPRASAAAERLWSDVHVTDTADAASRLEEHYCRMQKRGIDAQPPNGPGFCA